MKNRMLSVILIAVLVWAPFVSVSATEQNDRINTAISALSDLAIMRGYDDGLFYPEKNVTRMEFVALVLRTLGMENVSDSMKENKEFRDVDSSLWGAGEVNFAASMGLVDGYPDGNFGPNDTVTINQAVKVLVEALGYGELAKKQGYPGGYLSTASNLGIIDGVKTGENAATRGEIALLIYNSLEVKLMEDVNIGGIDEGKAKGDETLLQRLDITIMSTIVTGVYGASVSGSKLSENQVELSGEKYQTEIDASAFLGLKVRAWIKDDGKNLPTLVHIQTKGDESLVIKAEDIDSETTNDEIKYYEDGKEKSYDLSEPLVVVYNGKPISESQINDSKYLIPDDGYITVNEDSGNGNIVVVWDYDTFVVSAISDDTIYDVFGKSIKLDSKIKFSLLYEGVKAKADGIKSGDVLWIAESLDKELISCIVKNSSVTGILEEIKEDENETTYVIDGEEYILSKNFKKALGDGHSKALKLSLGDEAEFALNPGGKIAFVSAEETQKNLTYGYLIDAQLKSGPGSWINLKIMTQENAFVYLETDKKEKIRFGRNSGERYITSKEEAAEIIKAVSGEYEVTKQLVMYELNEEGFISELYLADTSANNGEFSMDEELSQMTYAGGVLEQEYFLSPKTPVFCVPNAGRYEEQFFATTAASYFSNSSKHNLILYDIENKQVGAVVAAPATESMFTDDDKLKTNLDTTNSPVMLIEKSSIMLNENGEEYFAVSGYVGRNYKEILVSDTITKTAAAKKDLKAGNVIQYDTNDLVTEKAIYSDYDKVMVIYRKIFECDEKDQETFQTWNYGTDYNVNASISAAFGVVSEYDLPYLTLRLNRDNGEGVLLDAEAPFVLTGGTAVLSYNKAAGVVEVKRLEDIAVGQKVFIRQRYNNTREVIILE